MRIGNSQFCHHLKDGTAYSPLRPTRLDEIKNFHVDIQVNAVRPSWARRFGDGRQASTAGRREDILVLGLMSGRLALLPPLRPSTISFAVPLFVMDASLLYSSSGRCCSFNSCFEVLCPYVRRLVLSAFGHRRMKAQFPLRVQQQHASSPAPSCLFCNSRSRNRS